MPGDTQHGHTCQHAGKEAHLSVAIAQCSVTALNQNMQSVRHRLTVPEPVQVEESVVRVLVVSRHGRQSKALDACGIAIMRTLKHGICKLGSISGTDCARVMLI